MIGVLIPIIAIAESDRTIFPVQRCPLTAALPGVPLPTSGAAWFLSLGLF